MKLRNGFVSNSSSSSFAIAMDNGIPRMKDYFQKHPIGISYSVSDGDSMEHYSKQDIEDFLAKLYCTGNMEPLDSFLLDYFKEELSEDGLNPEAMEGICVEQALDICHRHDCCATMEEALEGMSECILEGEPEESFYVFTVGNDAEFNSRENFTYRDYVLSEAMRDRPSELFTYMVYRIEW